MNQNQSWGLLRYGIPAYRLSNEVLDKETQRILNLGVQVKTNSPITNKKDFEKLKQEFDIVYLAIGADKPKRLPVLDYDQPWVMDGAEYLARTNSGEMPQLENRVVVIGGGSAAMDAARTARTRR